MKSVRLKDGIKTIRAIEQGGQERYNGSQLPQKIYLELTDRCNLNCSICYRKTWGHQGNDMSAEIADRCILQINEADIKEIVIGGIGEPTLSPHFQSILSILGRSGNGERRITITTNGTMNDKAIMESIVQNADHLVVSLDGLGDVFSEIRGISSDKVIKYIETLNEIHDYFYRNDRKNGSTNYAFRISLQMVLSKVNVDQIFSVIDTASDLGIGQVIISHLLPSSYEQRNNILYTLNEDQELKALFSRVYSYSLKKGLEVRLPARKLKTERHCRFIEDDTIMINAVGEVIPCYRFAHDCREFVFGREKQVNSYSFGSILEQSIKEIWQSPAYRRFRFNVRNNHYPSCPDCDLVDGCDQVRSTETDCYGEAPSCADCLWARNIVYCV